ncbi:hypothetical protein [Robbsia andropogonis]|uniref:hypothetical protein n=1 Tax=Robbsia andropogonis TaxID=28092 RepID=UPI000A9451B2|nr:hypothetical protein [Robbsia andropogonis]
MSNSEARSLAYFTDTFGRPLESGKIYIGVAGLDPIANPQTVYSDAENTVVLSQPIRTVHGHAASGGQYVHLFCTTPYSITIMDSSGRVNYTSLNESDPSLTNIGKSVPKSASTLAELRAMESDSTNQVFVTGYGMYYYDASDTTSPESIPRVIVADDGSRYKRSTEYVIGGWVQASAAADATVTGAHFSYNDESTGYAHITSNPGGATGGGLIVRTVSADGETEAGRVTIGRTGSVDAQGQIVSRTTFLTSGGVVYLTADGTRYLSYDGTQYNLPGAALYLNNSPVLNLSNYLTLNETQAVGCMTLGTSTPTVGSWFAIGQASGIYLFIRTA